MLVFLLRHATRNFTVGDVPLNADGMHQAQSLAEHPHWADLDRILSSPKRRAQMTVEPLVEKYNLPLKTLTELDQMRSAEGEKEFNSRVKNFLYRIEQKEFGENILVCSHSDWLSTALQNIPTDALDIQYKMFQCAEFMSFEVEDGLWKIR